MRKHQWYQPGNPMESRSGQQLWALALLKKDWKQLEALKRLRAKLDDQAASVQRDATFNQGSVP